LGPMSAGGTYTSPPIGINDSAVMEEDITEEKRKRGPRPTRTFLYLEEQGQGFSKTPGFDGIMAISELNGTIGGKELAIQTLDRTT